jgi:hypothetical protein
MNDFPKCICCDEVVIDTDKAAHAGCTQTIIEERDLFQKKAELYAELISNRVAFLKELGVKQAGSELYYSSEIDELEDIQSQTEPL